MVVVASLTTAATPTFAYSVGAGDTMSEIANQYDMSLEELAKLNPQVENINLIFPGQTIRTNENEREIFAIPEVKEQPKPVIKVQPEKQVVETDVNIVNVSAYEKDLLARLVRAEAESEPFAGKVAVAQVVLNRVDSSKFPNSIRGVIYAPGQFDPVRNGSINKAADAESIRAVEEAVTHRNNDNSLFFYNPRTASNRWLDSRPTTKVIGSHVFKK